MDKKVFSVEFLKSGLSVNTHVGCRLGCKYCVLTTGIDEFPREPILINDSEIIMDMIFRDKSFFINGVTPVYINNRTDPFLPEVIESTNQLLELFIKYKVKSPIIVITKLCPDKRFTEKCDKLNILFFYTFANLPGIDYNSVDVINKKNLAVIAKCVPAKNRYHYFRPIIPGLNDSIEYFETTIEQLDGVFKTIVIGGIRVNKENSMRFKINDYDREHKLLVQDFWNHIIEISNRYNITIIRHTSCAIALHMSWMNKLQYFEKEGHCIYDKCPNYLICKNKIGMLGVEAVDQIIKQYVDADYSWVGSCRIEFSKPIEQEMIAFLKASCGISVYAKQVILSPSEQEITNIRIKGE